MTNITQGPQKNITIADVSPTAIIGVTGTFASNQAQIGISGVLPSVSIALNSGEQHIGQIGGHIFTITDEFNTPNYPGAYLANMCVAESLESSATVPLRALSGCARVAGKGGIITSLKVYTSKAGTSMIPEVLFYNTGIPISGVAGDNSYFTGSWSNRTQFLGNWALTGMNSGVNSNYSYIIDSERSFPFTCAEGDKNLYYRIKTTSPFSGDANQSYFVSAVVDQD